MQRALANERKLAAEREKYDCRINDRTIETDGKGNTKKDTSVVSDLFYVNGVAIERTLQKDGKDLSADDQHKQDDHVMKETLKYSDQANAQKEEDKQNQELEDFMKAMMLANGRRENVDGHLIDINVTSVADLKIGGGLVANVHKGLWLHIHNQPRPDGVWLTDLAEGSGDARAALFLHPYFRFKETADNCHLYTATATQVGPVQVVKQPQPGPTH